MKESKGSLKHHSKWYIPNPTPSVCCFFYTYTKEESWDCLVVTAQLNLLFWTRILSLTICCAAFKLIDGCSHQDTDKLIKYIYYMLKQEMELCVMEEL